MKRLPMTMLDDAAITACEHGTFLRTLAETIRIVIEERYARDGIDCLLDDLAMGPRGEVNDGALDDIAEAFVAAHRERMRAL